MSKELPKWVAEEIQNVKFEAADTFNGTGYFLALNSKEKNADIQLYEPLPEGRYIVTADLPDSVKIDELKRGEIYLFEIKIFKGGLSDKVKQYLAEQYQVNMDIIYKYEIASAEEFNE